MNIYIKVIAISFVILYLVISFICWDFTWVSQAEAGGRFGFLFFGGFTSVCGCLAFEENKSK